MHHSVRRGFVAAAIFAGLVATVPGTVQAATQCGLVVCAEVTPTAVFTCTTVDNVSPGFDFVDCRGTGRPAAQGYSQQSIPGTLTWSGTTAYTYIYPSQSFGGPGPVTPSSTCTWAGLGEDRCGSTGDEITLGIGGWLPWGSCLDTYFGIDLEVSATATATATKTLPLNIATLDTATITETASARLSAVPLTERCAFQ